MASIPAPKKSTKGTPPGAGQTVGNLDKHESGKMVALNFTVPADFRKAFKGYAVDHDITMLELLRRAFLEYRDRH
jgi:hypothetical protein